MFPEAFIEALILGALSLTALGVLVLLGLFVHDYRKGRLW